MCDECICPNRVLIAAPELSIPEVLAECIAALRLRVRRAVRQSRGRGRVADQSRHAHSGPHRREVQQRPVGMDGVLAEAQVVVRGFGEGGAAQRAVDVSSLDLPESGARDGGKALPQEGQVAGGEEVVVVLDEEQRGRVGHHATAGG